jgi:hypothetical protein
MLKPPKDGVRNLYDRPDWFKRHLDDSAKAGSGLADNSLAFMAIELRLSEALERGLGLRQGEERRINERRTNGRATPERRRGDRRRTKLRNLIFTALALVLPSQLRLAPWRHGPVPHVSTTIDSVVAVSPKLAYEGIIREAAARYSVDASLIRSIMQAESAFDPAAVSRAGAMGLMQLMPDVADAFGVEHPFEPRENIMAGARLLRELLDQHHGNVKLAVASYNAGPTAVAHYGGVPPFRETQGYVKKVTALILNARRAGNN